MLIPNLEGLLVRLHEGHEARLIPADDAERQLRKLWRKYGKGSLSADQLKRRFTLADLKRSAHHDEDLRPGHPRPSELSATLAMASRLSTTSASISSLGTCRAST